MRQTRRERKEKKRKGGWCLWPFTRASLGMVALFGLTFFVATHWGLPLTGWEGPRRVPPLPPLDGGREKDRRPDVVPTLPGVMRTGPIHQRKVAITFDDGPDVDSTPQVLEVLKEHGVVATFFLVGNRAELYPELVRTIARQGHEIANHSFSHPRMERLSEHQAMGELIQTSQLLSRLSHQPILWFRPPYGNYNDQVLQYVGRAGMRTVLWSVDSRDWDGRSSDSIYWRVVSQVQPGSIVLFHCAAGASEIPYHTVDALPAIIKFLREVGYEMVTVGQLLGER